MKVTIELATGSNHTPWISKSDIDKNIAAQERAINNKSLSGDFILLSDTKSILEGIKNELPKTS